MVITLHLWHPCKYYRVILISLQFSLWSICYPYKIKHWFALLKIWQFSPYWCLFQNKYKQSLFKYRQKGSANIDGNCFWILRGGLNIFTLNFGCFFVEQFLIGAFLFTYFEDCLDWHHWIKWIWCCAQNGKYLNYSL